jgi:hypothetical protein
MTNKRTPAPADDASESAAGEEDPGAALDMSMSEPDPSKPAPEGKPSADTPLESPMPRSPILDREEPAQIANEEDIAPENDAPSKHDASKPKAGGKVKKPSPDARESGAGRKRG